MSIENSSSASARPLPVRIVLWLLRSLPTVVVLAMLAGVGAWGHKTNWALPKFSELTGRPANGAADPEWCAEHHVLEAECVECLTEDGKRPRPTWHGWCRIHGVAECPFEHADVPQLLNPPAVSDADLDAAKLAFDTRPRTKNNSQCKLHEKRIQLASLEAQSKAGIDIAVAEVEPVIESLAVNGQVTFDQTRVAHLSSRVPGAIWRVEKSVGDKVGPGDVLMLVESAEVGRAKGEFLQALGDLRLKQVNLEGLSASAKTGSVSARALREAQTAANEAEIRLLTAQQALANLGLAVQPEELTDLAPKDVSRRIQFLGIPESLVPGVQAATSSSNLVPLLAPIAGVVVEREAVRGEVVDTSIRLFTVADVDRLWVQLDIPQEDAKFVAIGQTMTFQPDGLADERQAEIAWISSSIDERTRTVRVRADVPNPDGRLKASAYGAGRIVLREQPAAVVVPNDAVQWEGCCHVVFVRDKDYLKEGAPKLFHVRKVRPGVKTDKFTEIIAGIRPGEVVASKGSEALRAALLQSFGEACCGHGHHHAH
jgi:cobalt-zinc-cadmium efflux system membrane fusion protein